MVAKTAQCSKRS